MVEFTFRVLWAERKDSFSYVTLCPHTSRDQLFLLISLYFLPQTCHGVSSDLGPTMTSELIPDVPDTFWTHKEMQQLSSRLSFTSVGSKSDGKTFENR